MRAPIVRAYCAEHKVSYAEVGLWEAYRIVVGYLNNVGLRARGPFECPMVQQRLVFEREGAGQ